MDTAPPGRPEDLVEFASNSIIGCDIDGRIRAWNAASRLRFGWSFEDVAGRSLADLAADPRRHQDDWAALLEAGSWDGSIRRLSPTGTEIRSRARWLLRRDSEGVARDVVEVGGDVADEAPGDAGHAPAEGRNRQLILHMPMALWQVDSRKAGQAFEALRAEGVRDIAAYLDAHPALVEQAKDTVVVTDANLAAMALFRGTCRQDLLRPVRYLFTGTPDMAKRVMVSHFRGDRSYREQAQIVAFDGSVRDVVFSVTYPTPNEDQDNTFILIEDITDQRRTEVQLRRLEAEYSHAARVSTLGELATSIAHEVKQPLSAIITNAETSLRWLGREEFNRDKLVQLTARILQSASRANEIILRTQAMAVRHASTRAPVDIGEIIRESLIFVRHEVESRSVDLSVGIEQDLATVVGDRVELQQVMVNLLVNAIQAVAPLPLDRRRVRVTARRLAETQIVVHVRDTGPGIAAEILPRLFDGFFTTKEGGMGMGLAICRSLIEAHDGSITAANDSEGGAVFEVRLPLAG